MLKREESREIIDGVKIKIPTVEETTQLIKKLNKISKTETGEIDYDDPKAIYMLFKKLVDTNIKEIKNITEEKFIDAYNNPSPEMEIICFEIGKVLSNAIQTMLRNNIAQLIETEMRLMQVEAITRINTMSEKAKEINKIGNKSK